MPLTPLSLQNFNLADPAQGKQYQYQLMQFLNGLLSQFNTLQNQIGAAILTPTTQNLGALISNTTFNAAGSRTVSITFTYATAITLTIQNLPIGCVFQMNFTNTAATGQNLTGVATQPGGASYTSWLLNITTGQKDMLAGATIGAGNNFFCIGIAMAGPAINMLGALN